MTKHNRAFLAQMVERWPFKPMAVGSIPTEGVFFLSHRQRSESKFKKRMYTTQAGVA